MNRKFLIINKLFLSMFVMAIFLGLGFVDAQTYQSANSVSECTSIQGYSADGWSSDSTNGTTYATSPSSPFQWYINKPIAIRKAAENTSNDKVCDGDFFNYDGITERKKSICSTDISTLISEQTALFEKYKQDENLSFGVGFNGYSDIWSLQSLMKHAGCQEHTDCKLGVVTISDFLFCPVCTAINNDRKDLDVNGGCNEHGDYVKTEDGLCCQPIPSQCVGGVGAINNPGGDKYTSNDSEFAVSIDFSSNTVGDLDYNFNNIEIIGATLEGNIATGGDNKTVLFSISPEADSDEINITIQDGFAKLGEHNCSVEIAPIYRDVECQPRNEREECNNNSDFEASEEPIIDYSFLDDFYCEKGVSESVPFCECTTPSKMNNCSDYGTGRIEDNNGCCISCGKDKIYDFEKDECVCDPNKKCSKEGYTVDSATCKCKCDPSKRCCGIELNTVVPFIGDCIEMTSQNNTMDPNDPNTSRVNQLNAFPFLMMGLSKIMVTVILIFSFLIVISAGLLMTTGALDGKGNQYSKGVEMVKNVVIGLILLGSSGLILRLINPNFFGG